MKKIFYTIVGCAAFNLLQAQDSLQTNQLNEVVVTATKYAKKLSETGKVVTVITREQIEKNAGKDLSQLLTEQTGVTVNGAFSNAGKDKSLFLRGASDKYTLILLDGVPLNDPGGVGGSFDLRLLSLDNIERIEIVKGSQSTLYGSNAVAGVINIISKRPDTDKPQFKGLASYGSYNTFKGNANVSGKAKWLEYDVNYVYNKTSGFSEAKDTTGKASFDKDGFTQHAFQTSLGLNITNDLKLSPYYRFTQSDGDFDAGSFADAPYTYDASLVNTGLIGNYKYNKGTLHFNYGYDFTKRYYASDYPFTSTGRFHHAEAFVNQNFSSHLQLVGGLSFQEYKINEPDTLNSIISSYASLFFHSDNGLNVELGGRFNHHNKYGNNFTYSFNPSFLINQKVKLFVNVTSGFRAPSISELFGPFGANPDLKPEKSYSQEAGLQSTVIHKKLSFTITGFNRSIDNVIVYAANGYENRDKQHDYGAEVELNCAPSNKWNFKASYAYVSGKITQRLQGKDTSFYNLVRRPKHAVNLFAGYQINEHLFISTSLQTRGNRTDLYFNPTTYENSEVVLSAYALWNAYAEYRFAKNKINFFVDAKNLTNNTNYYEVYGYGVQGFNLTGGIRFSL